MPDFNAKMHQNRFRTPLGELTALPRPRILVFPLPSFYLLAAFKGAYFKGKGVGRRGEGKGREGRGGEERGREDRGGKGALDLSASSF